MTHGIQEMVEPLKESIKDDLPVLNVKNIFILTILTFHKLREQPQAIIPPKPLILDLKASPIALCNWPHNELQDEEILLARNTQAVEAEGEEIANQELEMNLDNGGFNYGEVEVPSPTKDIDEPVEGNWGVEDIIDIPDIEIPSGIQTKEETFSALADSAPGKDPIFERAKTSQLAGELVACGDFENAANLLKKQIGVVNITPLMRVFEKVASSTQVKISGLPFTTPVNLLMSQDGKRPYTMVSLGQLTMMLKEGYRAMTKGKFTEALDLFRDILHHIPLLVLQNPQEDQDVYALIRICYNYILASKCELAKKEEQVKLNLSFYLRLIE